MKYTLLLCALLSTLANAATFNDNARVIRYEPNYKTIKVPIQVCKMVSVPVEVRYPNGETTTVKTYASPGQQLAGIYYGSQLGYNWNNPRGRYGLRGGHHSGSNTGAWIGGLMGLASAGTTVITTNPGTVVKEYREIEQCDTDYVTKTTQDGFTVFYDYNGMEGELHTYETPGSTISIMLDINSN